MRPFSASAAAPSPASRLSSWAPSNPGGYEAVSLAAGASKVTTLEYNRVSFEHPNIRSFTMAEVPHLSLLWPFCPAPASPASHLPLLSSLDSSPSKEATWMLFRELTLNEVQQHAREA
eukprot:748867-Hanusia_phi.AAC.1